jgi:hypothetical protein
LGYVILNYAEKYEIDGLDGKISKKIGCFKKNDTKNGLWM